MTGDTGGGVDGTAVSVTNLDDNQSYFVDSGRCWEGAWYTYTDMTAGAIAPAEGATFVPEMSDNGTPAAHASGDGFTDWGAGMGFNLLTPVDPGTSGLEAPCVPASGNPGSVDLSMFTGISFSAKASGHAVRLKVTDAQSVPTTVDGACVPSEIETERCEDSFGKVLTLTPEWQDFKFSWAELTQEGWGKKFPDGLQTSAIIAVQFQVTANTAFDYWVDNVAFIAPQ